MSDNDKTPPDNSRQSWEGPLHEPQVGASHPQAGASEPQPKATAASVAATGAWEREVVSKLAFASLSEQRRARRWSIFFKFLIFIYLFIILFMYRGNLLPEDGLVDGGKHTALVELQGIIADNTEANADNIVTALRDAFKSKGTKAVIIRINSPGGSPVQAGYINDEIRRLRGEYPDTPLYAVVTDICASGGYYIAAAADKIFVDKASIVGSIGVRLSGLSTFGFVEAMQKLGIERRQLAAGDDKAMLDPFSPLKQEEVQHIQTLLGNIHQQFISVVKQGRGDRLKGEDHELFNGLYWTGEQAIELGLVDALGSSSYVAREVVGAEKLVDFTHRPTPFERFADRLGVVMAETVTNAVGLNRDALR